VCLILPDTSGCLLNKKSTTIKSKAASFNLFSLSLSVSKVWFQNSRAKQRKYTGGSNGYGNVGSCAPISSSSSATTGATVSNNNSSIQHQETSMKINTGSAATLESGFLFQSSAHGKPLSSSSSSSYRHEMLDYLDMDYEEEEEEEEDGDEDDDDQDASEQEEEEREGEENANNDDSSEFENNNTTDDECPQQNHKNHRRGRLHRQHAMTNTVVAAATTTTAVPLQDTQFYRFY
jgi:hypothetical protein